MTEHLDRLDLFARAADALSDCIWIMRDKPATQHPLPAPTRLVLSQAVEVEKELRAAADDQRPEDLP